MSAPLETRSPGGALLIAATVLLGSCAAPYTVRTVGKGKTALNVSLGGPLFANLGAPFPMPAVVAGAQYGITDAWDVHGNFHLLPALYKNAGLDLGVTRRLVKQRRARPELTATFRLSLLTNFDSARLYPELEVYGSYLVKRRWLLYLGLTTLYDFFWNKDPKVRVHWGPVLGVDVRFAKRYSFGLSFRWISPQENLKWVVVDYASPAQHGMIFIQLGFRVNFGTWGGGA